jgi:pimeloyl-ACP methyl ester carboxylesterase
MRGEKVKAFYTYDDMADDGIGVLDALDIEKAHICGMSMGGAIAQTVAIRNPSRVLSLISIYGPVGDIDIPRPKPEILEMLMTPPPTEREAYIDNELNIFKAISGSGYKFEESWLRDLAGRAFDRSFYPKGPARLFLAGLAHGNRLPALKNLAVPTLLIHGDEDPLVSVDNSKAAAEAIPNAKLMIIKGMGHDLPHRGAWPHIAEAIAEYTEKVE